MDTQEQPQCFICRKHRGEFHLPGGAIYEDDLLYAGHIFNESGPTYLGYLMAELKRHAPGLADQTDEEARALGMLVAHLSQALKASEGAEHIYALVLGDHVPHLHVHVVARYPGAPREYWGLHVDEWPNAPQGGPEEIEAVCQRLRQALQRERET
jgi:diadenosine tetraphosphate (Ap4A) HIT family hydrolase